MRDVVEGALCEYAGLDPTDAKDLEIGVFNAALDFAAMNNIAQNWCSELFQEAYMAKARGALSNLRSEALRRRIEGGEFMPHEVPLITRESLAPELWQPIMDRERARSKEAYEFRQASMTEHIKCGTCLKKGWKSKITYYELQTRSADEPMTLMIKCHTCGHRWKM